MGKTENQLKYENYKEQFQRLNSALKSGFNLEAMFIEYAIMEDRTESILRHAEKWEAYLKSRKGRAPNIDSKIRYIQKLAYPRYVQGILLSDCRERSIMGDKLSACNLQLYPLASISRSA